MRLIDEVNILRVKVDQIDKAVTSKRLIPSTRTSLK